MTITAKFGGKCGCGCGERFVAGERIEWQRGTPTIRAACAARPVPARDPRDVRCVGCRAVVGDDVSPDGYCEPCHDEANDRAFDPSQDYEGDRA